jgi:hypothetical protein
VLLVNGPLGCSDPSMERQAKFDREVSALAADYGKTLSGRADLLSSNPTDESLAALRALADRAKGMSGGSSTQESAARSLASSIYRTAGALALSRAAAIEARHEVDRRGRPVRMREPEPCGQQSPRHGVHRNCKNFFGRSWRFSGQESPHGSV